MDKTAILTFLQENPQFLTEQADQLDVQPSNKKFVHFSEVQLQASEEKVKRLENEMDMLIENAKHNQKIITNLFELSVNLIKCTSEPIFSKTISQTLINYFNLDAYAIRLLPQEEKTWFPESFFLPEKDPSIQRIEQLTQPICFHYLPEEMMKWLDTKVTLQSFIQLPLYIQQQEQPDGIMVIGSANPRRFKSEYDTLYVNKMAEAISACLNRLREL